MSDFPYTKSMMADVGLKLMPPMVRESLLKDKEFREKYGFKTDTVITFGDSGLSFQRNKFFSDIRKVLSGKSELKVTDIKGQEWNIKNEPEEKDLPKLVIYSENQQIFLPNFAVFSSDPSVRLRSLNKEAIDVNLPINSLETWRTILSQRSLENDEIDDYHSDIFYTPVYMERIIHNMAKRGEVNIKSIIPSSRKYYTRLVGNYNGSKSIKEYAETAGRNFFLQLSDWHPYDGFLFSLLMSSHSVLTSEINVAKLNKEDLVRAFEFLVAKGDRISQVGAIEMGLRILPERPEIQEHIARLVEEIRDDVDDQILGFKLLSALFVLVDGELSRLRLMANDPPFYRRLSSLSHSALIHRQLITSGVSNEFCEWAFQVSGEQFYTQSLADIRLEPRWDPEFVSSTHMKADFIGRIIIGATNFKDNIEGSELYDLILNPERSSLTALNKSIDLYLPGPLEGAEDTQNDLPTDVSEMVEKQLKTDDVTPDSFIALVNTARIFKVESDHLELATNALKLCNYRLSNIESKMQFHSILYGLATVAAIGRYPTLANEVRILMRRYRIDAQYSFSIVEALRVCLLASASYKDLDKWREIVGEWLTELAFGEFEKNEGIIFHSNLQCLCSIVPKLWASCSKADAALKAYNESHNLI